MRPWSVYDRVRHYHAWNRIPVRSNTTWTINETKDSIYIETHMVMDAGYELWLSFLTGKTCVHVSSLLYGWNGSGDVLIPRCA